MQFQKNAGFPRVRPGLLPLAGSCKWVGLWSSAWLSGNKECWQGQREQHKETSLTHASWDPPWGFFGKLFFNWCLYPMIMKAVIRELTMRGRHFLHTAANRAVSRKHSSAVGGWLGSQTQCNFVNLHACLFLISLHGVLSNFFDKSSIDHIYSFERRYIYMVVNTYAIYF